MNKIGVLIIQLREHENICANRTFKFLMKNKYLITNGAIELHGILILSLQNNFI